MQRPSTRQQLGKDIEPKDMQAEEQINFRTIFTVSNVTASCTALACGASQPFEEGEEMLAVMLHFTTRQGN